MMLLSEAMDKHANQISIQVPCEIITPELAEEITSLVSRNEGTTKLRVVLVDSQNKITLDLLSGKYKVKASDFLKEIKKMPGILYSISSVG